MLRTSYGSAPLAIEPFRSDPHADQPSRTQFVADSPPGGYRDAEAGSNHRQNRLGQLDDRDVRRWRRCPREVLFVKEIIRGRRVDEEVFIREVLRRDVRPARQAVTRWD